MKFRVVLALAFRATLERAADVTERLP